MTKPPLEAWEALKAADPAAASQVISQLRKAVFVPHSGGQAEIMASDARFRVVRAGRRFGKTQLAAHEVTRAALAKPDQVVWWVANNDNNVRRGYRAVKAQVPRLLLTKDPPSDAANNRMLQFTNGSVIEFYTAGTPDALVGEGVNFLVVDEAALIEETVWSQRLRPTLSDTGGRALLISTPRGRNWFHKAWYNGQGKIPGWASWHFPTLASPFIPESEVEEARATMPDLIFRSEYLAEFVAAAASMFNLEGERDDGRTWNAVVEGLHAPEGWVTLGVDLAKKEDFTVICGCNTETRMPSVYERFNEISWAIQQDLILEQVAALEADPAVEGVTVVVDSTGVGEVVHDNLEDAGLDVVPVNFGSGNIKERMVRLLAADFEHGRAFIPEAMRDEHEHYEYEISPLGRFKFAAPDGEHDDKVSAKMLENWGCVHEAPAGIQAYMPALDDEPLEDDGLDMPPDEEEAAELLPDDPSDIMERTMPRAAPERY